MATSHDAPPRNPPESGRAANLEKYIRQSSPVAAHGHNRGDGRRTAPVYATRRTFPRHGANVANLLTMLPGHLPGLCGDRIPRYGGDGTKSRRPRGLTDGKQARSGIHTNWTFAHDTARPRCLSLVYRGRGQGLPAQRHTHDQLTTTPPATMQRRRQPRRPTLYHGYAHGATEKRITPPMAGRR